MAIRRLYRTFGWLGIAVVLIGGLLCQSRAERVLLVTTEQNTAPTVYNAYGGCYAFTDLVGAGIPFDVCTYGRFLTMDLARYDVFILNGHTSPAPVANVSQKCQDLKAAGKKIFINGYQPFRSYDTAGKTYTEIRYASTLFGANMSSTIVTSGSASVPASVEKDPWITSTGIQNGYVRWYTMSNPPAGQIYLAGKMVGFVGPTGGAICGANEYEYNLLDYGKLVNYMRHGDAPTVGFANDRVGGLPIVAFHTDCHAPSQPSAVNGLSNLSARYGIPLDNTLVLSAMTTAGAQLWNSMSSPLMAVSSHTRNHPQDWWPLTMPSVESETRQAILDERAMIPRTLTFLSFSGNKNPSTEQLDQLVQWGVLFDGQGQGSRYLPRYGLPDYEYQVMPINRGWLKNLACCQSTPTWPSETLYSDNVVYNQNNEYDAVMAFQHASNVKYGLYSYGYFHDTFNDPTDMRSVHGVPMHTYIDRAMSSFDEQGVYWMFPHDLVARLQDYVAGDISYTSNPDGSITITVYRPNALANEIKVGFKGAQTPVASGASVVSQQVAGTQVYVSLLPETTSTVTVNWEWRPPRTPAVLNTCPFVGRESTLSWRQPDDSPYVVEYQYAVGTTPGATDVMEWTSAGMATSVSLAAVPMQHNHTYYASVRSRYEHGGWSDPGISIGLTADLTPPYAPMVTDDGDSQDSIRRLHAMWTAQDPESGVVAYKYAVGTSQGSTDVKGWTDVTAAETTLEGLTLRDGTTYYFSVRAMNTVGEWSEVGYSNGIVITIPPLWVRDYPDGNQASMESVVVTRTFPGEFYVELSDRSAGIKIVSDEPVEEGQVLNVQGTVQHSDTEAYVEDAEITHTGTSSLKPLLMSNRALAGSTQGLIQGSTLGRGLNNVGLLVTTLGRVTSWDTDYIFIDDGSGIAESTDQYTVKVLLHAPHSFRPNAYVKVTGISVIEHNIETGKYQRAIRTQSNGDVIVLMP